MVQIGELADLKRAEWLRTKALEKGIGCHLTRQDNGLIGFFIEDSARAGEAFELYRVALGMPKVFRPDKEWENIQRLPLGQISMVLIIISVMATFFVFFKKEEFLYWFVFSPRGESLLSVLSKGEIWRVITPIFLHFGWLHILFNMLWLKDLGSIMEQTKGKGFFLIFVLMTGLLSNFGQYLVSTAPFGGMSGVVYALLGHLWMSKSFHPEYPYALPKRDVVLMIGWFIFCFTGLMGPIANSAHGVGLGLGMLVGIFPLSQQFSLRKGALYFSLAFFFIGGTPIVDWLRLNIFY